jgi:hypothetical protein
LGDGLGNAVLLDNSTVYGAREASETSVLFSRDGEISGPIAAKFRALMDVLEAIVLYENVVVEPRQGDYDLWEELAGLQGSEGTEILRQEMVEEWEARPALIHMSLDRLDEYLRSDDFATDAAVFVQGLNESAVPESYTQGYDIESSIRRDFVNYLEPEDYLRLGHLSRLLEGADRAVKNYAAFAFGGFFYQAVAHAYSVSYVPHTWRSGLVARGMGGEQLDFGKYAVGVAGDVRQTLTKRLNSEFGGAVLEEEFPVIASYVVSQVSRRSELLRAAVEIRETPPAKAFRQWTAEIQSALRDQRDLPLVKKAAKELTVLAKDLGREFGVAEPSAKQDFTIRAQVPSGVLSAETKLGVPKTAPKWMRRILHRRTYFVFLRDLARKSASLPPFIERFRALPA